MRRPQGPDDRFERILARQGARIIAGVDEAGRGPLAGPVAAAAVILRPDAVPDGLDDSKRLDEADRERLFAELLAHAQVALAFCCPQSIDRVNIRQATLLAMRRAVLALPIMPDCALIDGRDSPPLPIRTVTLIKGDGRSVSIAAASIVAKVMRDRAMKRADAAFPHYGLARHKGYPTQDHRAALVAHGPCPLHRRSFAGAGPVKVVSSGPRGVR